MSPGRWISLDEVFKAYDREVLAYVDAREDRLAGADDEEAGFDPQPPLGYAFFEEERLANTMDPAAGGTHHPEPDEVEGDSIRSEGEAP
jgi:hypothetical protein